MVSAFIKKKILLSNPETYSVDHSTVMIISDDDCEGYQCQEDLINTEETYFVARSAVMVARS